MKNHLLYKLTAICFLCVCFNPAVAQKNYKYTAPITFTGTSGFYQLTLSPQIVARCKTDLSDIRILNEAGNPVPYVLQKDLPVKYKRNFVAFDNLPFLPDSSTALLVKSPAKAVIQNLYLTIKNNNVKRIVNLSGSDDLKNWYAISEDIALNGSDNPGKDNYEQLLSFPASSYQYYKVSLVSKNKVPVKILNAGIYSDDQFSGRYQELPAPVITQKDSDVVSHIKLKFSDAFEIDKITLKFLGPRFFKRDIEFYKKGPSGSLADPESFSTNPCTFQIGQITNELYANILNKDNAPLKLTLVTAYQLSRSLSSYLETGKKYHLAFGDSSARQPQYDLRFFTDSINKSLSVAQIGTVIPNTTHTFTVVKKTTINYNYIMWATIIITLLVLGFFTYKLMNDVKAKENS